MTDNSEILSAQEQLGPITSYRCELRGVVTKAGQGKCLVLDMGYNTTALLALPDFVHTGHYETIRQAIKDRAMTIAYERVISETLLRSLTAELQRSHRKVVHSTTADMSEEERNLTLFNDLVAGAYRLGATDIHIAISGDEINPSQVRLRIYGRVSTWKALPTSHLRAALSAGYSKKSVKNTNSEPQWSSTIACSTITSHEVSDTASRRRKVSGRFTSRPTVDGGCKVSIRLLDTDMRDIRIPSLADLGYAASHIEDQLLPALRKNQGCILIAGGTGSGKSTTLRTFMHDLPAKDSLERYSVEDPVEYVLPGVVQLSIQRASDASEEKTRLQFNAALRDLMRMDPDAIMIGEIRDAETAQLATEMVNTGHRVLTTVHGNGCVDVLDRLTGKTLAVPALTLASGSYLLVCMYQKLLPVLCPTCKRPAKGLLTATQVESVRKFGLDVGTLCVTNPEGCEECRLEGIAPTGTRGLTVVAEVLTPTRELLPLVREQNWVAIRDHWRQSRRTGFGDPDMTGKTAFEHAIYKMSRGLVDINDIERDFEPLASYEIVTAGVAS